ncbi:MAG: chalcone isomerase family protein [Methylotenera sp.]
MKQLLKFILATLFFVLTFSAQAIEVKGVKVDEAAKVGGNALVLNGAGVRTKMMFKVYVAALYLTQKQADANAVLGDSGNKRVSMHFLRELSAEKLLHAMDEGFTANNSAAEMAAIDTQMKAFRQMMTSAKEVKEGDVILLDYTAAGTQVSLNGKVLGQVEGEAFNHALLRVWLGGHPVDASLKKAMLGQ